mgnify:FL=1
MKSNYLNNKDILKEIHKSKTTYCSFSDPSYANYDLIVHNIKQINKKNIKAARQNRADRLSRLAHEAAQAQSTEKLKPEEFEVRLKDVADTDVVFRVMTWDHVPFDQQKSSKATKFTFIEEEPEEPAHSEYDEEEPVPTKYMKCNFPPFQHYKVDTDGSFYCVGKSHWTGDLATGHWSKDHGAMTKKLALMLMKLCERYATRSNWRGYTYNEEMRGQALLQLSQIGLQFDES